MSASKQLIWEGVAQGEITGDKANREDNINSDILRMFKDYPIAIPVVE
jgi:hypothetical protein